MSYVKRYVGENVLVFINGTYKLAKIDKIFPNETTSGLNNDKYLGHIYHKGKSINIVFYDNDIETVEGYEKQQKINKNIITMMDLFIEDELNDRENKNEI